MFAIALIDASIIGAAAISLSSADAIVMCFQSNILCIANRVEAKGFYAVYCGLIIVAAGLVLAPGIPLGLIDQRSANSGRNIIAQRRRLFAFTVQ